MNWPSLDFFYPAGGEFCLPGPWLPDPDPERDEPHQPAVHHQPRDRGRAVERSAHHPVRAPAKQSLRHHLPAADHDCRRTKAPSTLVNFDFFQHRFTKVMDGCKLPLSFSPSCLSTPSGINLLLLPWWDGHAVFPAGNHRAAESRGHDCAQGAGQDSSLTAADGAQLAVRTTAVKLTKWAHTHTQMHRQVRLCSPKSKWGQKSILSRLRQWY